MERLTSIVVYWDFLPRPSGTLQKGGVSSDRGSFFKWVPLVIAPASAQYASLGESRALKYSHLRIHWAAVVNTPCM